MNPPARPSLLVIDDEPQIRRLLRFSLEEAGYSVREAENGQMGLREVAHQAPEGVILDLGLPDLDGLQVLSRLREWSRVPVLVLSVRNRDEEKILALDQGADDYLTKPFHGGELLARVRAILRRVQTTSEPSVVRVGTIEFDFAQRQVRRDGQEVKLTAKEYAFLRLLMQYRGRVVTHREILREVWGPGAEGQTHYLRVQMAHLRQKLETTPNRPAHLRTEAGIGYRLVE